MAQETDANDTEHVLDVTSVQVYATKVHSNQVVEGYDIGDVALEFEDERELRLECNCGESFSDSDTAIDHLRSVDAGADQNE